MEELLKKEREFVVPGDEIVKSMNYLPGKNCFREGDSIYSKKTGLVGLSGRVISIIPLNGVYIPKEGDMVIGKITEVQSSGWVVSIDSYCDAYLPLSGVKEYIDTYKTDLSTVYDMGDFIYGKISRVNKDTIHISMQDLRSKKLKEGRIITTNPAKVPRVIGKQGSMISMITKKTGSMISIGQNGLIWLDGGKDELVIKTIELIEKESYINGLTDRISKFLESEGKE